MTCRHSPERRLVFALNHHGDAKTVMGLPSGVELLSGQVCAGALELAPFGVAIVEELR